jgi:hypothetical protein
MELELFTTRRSAEKDGFHHVKKVKLKDEHAQPIDIWVKKANFYWTFNEWPRNEEQPMCGPYKSITEALNGALEYCTEGPPH